MNDANPYRSPEATLVPAGSPSGSPSGSPAVLAGRGARLGAVVIDTVILTAIVLPMMFAGHYFDAVMQAAAAGRQVPFELTLLWTLIGFAVFVVVQGYPLHTDGQTWGKRALGIRIVDLAGNKPSLVTLLARRYLPANAINVIPFIGIVLQLVNVLLIFRDDRRCGHDLIAGTRVVSAR